MNFVKFSEYNDHEGERWNFWLQIDGNEEELEKLSTMINAHEMEEFFKLCNNEAPEEEVDILVKHSDIGYMEYHNKVTGKFTCPEVADDNEDEDAVFEWISDQFCKGQIREHFKEV